MRSGRWGKSVTRPQDAGSFREGNWRRPGATRRTWRRRGRGKPREQGGVEPDSLSGKSGPPVPFPEPVNPPLLRSASPRHLVLPTAVTDQRPKHPPLGGAPGCAHSLGRSVEAKQPTLPRSGEGVGKRAG